MQRRQAGEDIFAGIEEEEGDEDVEDNTAIIEGIHWSDEEERRLLMGLKKYGNDWAAVTKLVKTR